MVWLRMGVSARSRLFSTQLRAAKIWQQLASSRYPGIIRFSPAVEIRKKSTWFVGQDKEAPDAPAPRSILLLSVPGDCEVNWNCCWKLAWMSCTVCLTHWYEDRCYFGTILPSTFKAKQADERKQLILRSHIRLLIMRSSNVPLSLGILERQGKLRWCLTKE